MKTKVAVGFVFLLFILSGFLFWRSAPLVEADKVEVKMEHETPDPESVVRKYCALAKEGKYEELTEITTHFPEEFFVAEDKEVSIYRELKGEVKEGDSIPKDVPPLPEGITKVMPVMPKLRDDGSAKLINRDATYIDAVRQVWVFGNQARVRVEMRSTENSRYFAVKDFLLFAEEGKWKVFLVTQPRVVNVYGIPEGYSIYSN